VHCPSRYRHRLPGGRSSSLVGVPSSARTSFSLLPASATAGTSDDERIGEADAVAVADPEASGEAGVVAGEGRGRAAGCTIVPFFGCTDGDCGDVSRAKSFPMFRAVSQPDKSNSPTLTMCLIRPLIFILCPTPLESPRDALCPDCGTPPSQLPKRTSATAVAGNGFPLTTRRRPHGSAAPPKEHADIRCCNCVRCSQAQRSILAAGHKMATGPRNDHNQMRS
jgi:hypothetical protein